MSWDYRLLAHLDENDINFVIHEVYYDEHGIPSAYSENASQIRGTDEGQINWDLEEMTLVISKPILWYGVDFPSEFTNDETF